VFVRREPLEAHPVLLRAFQQIQRDDPFLAEDHVVGNPRFAASPPVFVPRFLRQIKICIHKRVDISVGIPKVHRDNTVVGFPRCAAVLPLHARRLVPLLRETCFIDQGDSVLSSVIPHDDLLNTFANRSFVPFVKAQLNWPPVYVRKCSRLGAVLIQSSNSLRNTSRFRRISFNSFVFNVSSPQCFV